MYLTNQPTKQYELAQEGQYDVVLADVTDLGMVTSTFNGETKTQRKVMLTWLAVETDSEGNPFRFFKRYTASLHEKSNLHAAIKKMTGVAPTEGFELDDLIGVNSKLDITHQINPQTKRTYTVVDAIMRLKTKNLEVPADFVRKQDANKKKAAAVKPTSTASTAKVKAAQEPEPVAYQASDSDIGW